MKSILSMAARRFTCERAQHAAAEIATDIAVGVVSEMRMWRDLIDEAASHSRATLPKSNRFSFPSVHGSTVTNARTSRLPHAPVTYAVVCASTREN